MSAFGGKAEVIQGVAKSPLIAISGHLRGSWEDAVHCIGSGHTMIRLIPSLLFSSGHATNRMSPDFDLFSIPLINTHAICYRSNMVFGRTLRILSYFVAFAILVGALGYGWPAMANMRSAPATIQMEMGDSQPADPMVGMCPCGMSGPMGSCLCGQCSVPVQAIVNADVPEKHAVGLLPSLAIQMRPEISLPIDPAPPKPSSIS